MVTIKPISKKNPQDQAEPAKFYARAVATRKVDLNKLADLMSDGSTVRRNDIYAVLVGMVDTITKELKEGSRVALGELGTLYLSVSSTPVDDVEDFNISQVIGNRINYLPAIGIKNEMKTIRYTTAKK